MVPPLAPRVVMTLHNLAALSAATNPAVPDPAQVVALKLSGVVTKPNRDDTDVVHPS